MTRSSLTVTNRVSAMIGKIALGLLLCAQSAFSVALTSADFTAVPPTLRGSTPPLVMLAMSRDHQLYVKAYTDYSDLDGNGTLDTSYADSFNYYGYFNSNICYNYDATNNYYEPVRAATGPNGHSCGVAGARWSGNFLNWATMTRMDVVRAVIYGGARLSGFDTATSGGTQGTTVLERAFLPADNHAFVKVYAGTDIDDFTPYEPSGNVISLCNTSLSSTGAPLLRIAQGNWRLWASSEVTQCRFSDEGSSGLSDQPAYANRPSGLTGDLNVRVKVCVNGVDTAGNNRCKGYAHPTTGEITYKPVGILQQYGDDGRIRFGLMTGSYNAKISGGLLRKNMSAFANNAVSSNDEIDLSNGRINTGVSGIIRTLSDLRIVQYSFANHNYTDCDTYSISITTFMDNAAAANRRCRNWGNPISEIYLEALRYMAGITSPTAAFNVSDTDQIATLPFLSTWQNPLSTDNACANCSIIVISTGLNSFDGDNLGSAVGLPGISSVADVQAQTNAVGSHEGITASSGNTYLIGRNGSTNNDVCTAKTLSNLSSAKGICPELPSLQGGYDLAGLAYYAYTNDLHPSLPGIQKVNTYAVALSESLPSFEINVNGRTVSFVPTCQANTTSNAALSSTGWTDCSLVDVRVESQTSTSGSFLVAWEDSLWGSDYDMDGIARIEYCVGSTACPATPANSPSGTGVNAWSNYEWKTGLTANQIQFRISAPQANAGNALRFGYVISGVETGTAVNRVTNAAGVTGGVVSVTPQNGVQSYLLRQSTSSTNPIRRISSSSGNNIIYAEPVVFTTSTTTTAGRLLENPLWYAAKYGNFNDLGPNPNELPDAGEWDVRNINGLSDAEGGGPDGLPDNYFPVRNPANLVTSLQQVLQRISASVASSTAAAVVANSSRGAGAVYQAVYYPQFQRKDTDNRVIDTVDWVGELHALFIDDDGVIREDNGVKGQLEAMTIDYGIEIYYDEVEGLTLVQRYNGLPFSATTREGQPIKFEEMKPIWSARDELAALTATALETQRPYTDSSDTGRYIFTWIDQNKDGRVDNSAGTTEVLPFVPASFPIATSTPGPTTANQHNYRYLGLTNANLAAEVVNYIRGVDGGGRSRRIDYDPTDADNTEKPWLLGDIIDSTPVIVGAPNAGYDRMYGDSTYQAYRQAYENRRQVAYVGGNDGMLHAFNAGKWVSATKTFDGANQPLGGELWAYVPSNLLPHLQWLREINYPHVFFVDGSIKAFDVKIFTPDATHPNGWGTILVAGMRFGGGAFPLDTDGDGTNDTTARSAYVVFDVTDPESPPRLLAELTTPTLGFTLGEPVVIKRRVAADGSFTSTSANEWILVAGTGPNVLASATSTQDSGIVAWRITSADFIESVTINSSVVSGMAEGNSFVGNMTAVDWDNDFSDDIIYAGTVGGTVASPIGTVKRIKMNASSWGLSDATSATANTLFNPAKPVFAPPSVSLDTTTGNSWVFFGTGRFLVPQDSQSTSQQAYYGIKEPRDGTGGAVTYEDEITSDVIDVTDIGVAVTGEVRGAGGSTLSIDGDTISNFNDLRRKIAEGNGWVRYLSVPSGEGAERNFTASTFFFSSILFTTYQPDADLCSAKGDGALYSISRFTGTAAPFAPIGTKEPSDSVFGTGIPESLVSMGLGRTLPSQVVITGGSGSGGTSGSLIQGSYADFKQPPLTNETSPSKRQSWREIEINFGI